jgi:hypothetical protein
MELVMQEMCNKIQYSSDIFQRTLQNLPFSKLKLFHIDRETDGDDKDSTQFWMSVKWV